MVLYSWCESTIMVCDLPKSTANVAARKITGDKFRKIAKAAYYE